MEFFFVLLWILCGFGAAHVASGRGRDGCLWFAVGFFLGPLGLLFALLYPEDKDALERRALRGGSLRKCPRCAELVKAEAMVCRFCGADLFEKIPKAELLRRARESQAHPSGKATPPRLPVRASSEEKLSTMVKRDWILLAAVALFLVLAFAFSDLVPNALRALADELRRIAGTP